MSIELLLTLDALLKDEAFGLKAKTDALAETLKATYDNFTPSPGPLSTDFNFVPWAQSGQGVPSTRGNVMMRPNTGNANERYRGTNRRDGVSRIDIGFETFSASVPDLGFEAALVLAALLQVLDDLRDYSDAHDGTVIGIQSPLDYRFGEYDGPTSYGFILTATIQEMSTRV